MDQLHQLKEMVRLPAWKHYLDLLGRWHAKKRQEIAVTLRQEQSKRSNDPIYLQGVADGIEKAMTCLDIEMQELEAMPPEGEKPY